MFLAKWRASAYAKGPHTLTRQLGAVPQEKKKKEEKERKKERK
jgi:hypothetical protein